MNIREIVSITFFSSNRNSLLSDIAETVSVVKLDGDPDRSEGVQANNDVGGPHMSLPTGLICGGSGCLNIKSSSSDKFPRGKLKYSISSVSSEFISYSSGNMNVFVLFSFSTVVKT